MTTTPPTTVSAAAAAAAAAVVGALVLMVMARMLASSEEGGRVRENPSACRASLDAYSSETAVAAHVETLRTGDIVLLHKHRYRCAYDRFLSCTVGSHIVLVLRPKSDGPAYAIDIAPASNRAYEAELTVFEYLRPASTRGVGCGARIMRLREYLAQYLRRHRAKARTYRLRGPPVHADALLDALHALHGRCAYPRKTAIITDFVRDAIRERWRPATAKRSTDLASPPTTMHCAQLLMWLLVVAGVLPQHYEWKGAVPSDVGLKRSLRLSYSEVTGADGPGAALGRATPCAPPSKYLFA